MVRWYYGRIIVTRKPMCHAVYIYNSFDIDTAIRVQVEYILPCLCTSVLLTAYTSVLNVVLGSEALK